MRIIQVIQELSQQGGAESVAFELARAWDRAGTSNAVIASNVKVSGISTIHCMPWAARIPTRGRFSHIGRLIVVPMFTIGATAAMRKDPDAVYISHGDTLDGDILVVHAVNEASLASKQATGGWQWRLNPMHAWVGLRNRYMIRGLRYRCYVAVSSRVARELQLIHAVPPHRIQVIPNGIDLKRFRPAPATRAATRHKLGIPEKAKLLMFAGHEFERKGLGYVIGALTELGQSTWLLVVGSDSARGYRRAAGAAASRIVFAGARTDMPALYAAADAFVLPTYYETFSLVCMEALACGIPVLATRVGGIEDYLEDGVNGFGITRDASTIAQKARLVFADEAQNSRLRAGARATAERFGWDNIASNYASIASQVLSERRVNRHDAE